MLSIKIKAPVYVATIMQAYNEICIYAKDCVSVMLLFYYLHGTKDISFALISL